mmetsp:Transcript_12263/g.14806  ORF Transcript_12263/g.14806 Transcript_12263/m.14806 type:complete len:175 (-) Transcript_12263:42-566(-)
MSFFFGSEKKDEEKIQLQLDLKRTENQLKVANETLSETVEQLEILQNSRQDMIKEAVEKAIEETKATEKEKHTKIISELITSHKDELARKEKECKKILEMTEVLHKREVSFIEETKEGIIAELNRDIEAATTEPKGFLSNMLGLSGGSVKKKRIRDSFDEPPNTAKRSSSLSIF